MDVTKDEIEQMSFEEILSYAASLKGFTSVPICTAMTKRLYEIALYDHHVEKEHRKHAWSLLAAVKSGVEEALQGDPAALVSYRQANSAMESKVSLFGVGSLAWQIEEDGISSKGNDALFAFLGLPENASRLDDFYTVVGPETAAKIKERLK